MVRRHVRVARRSRGVVLLASTLIASAAAAASPAADADPPPTRGGAGAEPWKVQWADLARLVERQPRVAASRFEVDAARAGVDAAAEVPNPTLEGTVAYARERRGDRKDADWGISLTIPFGWIAQRDARMQAATAEVDAAAGDGEALRRDIVAELRSLFWSVAFHQARLATLEILATQTEALVGTVTQRVDKGELRPIEATRVEIELERVRGEIDAARIDLASRRSALALWLGAPPGTVVEVVADFTAIPQAADRRTVLTRAHGSHPALAASRARVRLRESELESERLARVPAVSLSGFTSHSLDARSYGVGLSVDLPLWNWNSGRIAQAEARLGAAREQAAAEALDLDAKLIDAQARCEASAVVAGRFGREVVPRAEKAAAMMERFYELGDAKLIEVIDARRTLLDVRRDHLSALAAAQNDCSRLQAQIEGEPR